MTQLLLVVITLTLSPDKQGAYTDAYNAAKNIVNGSPNVITNAAYVTAVTQRVNAETGLNGDTNLATAKQQAKDTLRQMTHLSDAQKESITGQIDSATQVTGVQSVKDNATNLDNSMNQLRIVLRIKMKLKQVNHMLMQIRINKMHTTQLLQVLKISLMQRVSRHLIHLQ